MKSSSSILASGTLQNNVGDDITLHIVPGSSPTPYDTVVPKGQSFTFSQISYISGITVGSNLYNTYVVPPNYGMWEPFGSFYYASGFDLNTNACRPSQPVTSEIFTSDAKQSLTWDATCGANITITLSPGKGGNAGGGGNPSSGGDSGGGPKKSSNKTWMIVGIVIAVLLVLILLAVLFSKRK